MGLWVLGLGLDVTLRRTLSLRQRTPAAAAPSSARPRLAARGARQVAQLKAAPERLRAAMAPEKWARAAAVAALREALQGGSTAVTVGLRRMLPTGAPGRLGLEGAQPNRLADGLIAAVALDGGTRYGRAVARALLS